MTIKFNKENKVVKSNTTKTGKWCSITLVVQCILTAVLGFIALAPFLAGFGGICLGATLIIIAVFLTAITAGFIWASVGVRNFFGKGFSVVGKALNDPEKIIEFFKPHIIYIAISILIVSAVGFIYNLIYFIKHEKANKGRFIASCIILGVAIINLIFALVFYLTYKK